MTRILVTLCVVWLSLTHRAEADVSWFEGSLEEAVEAASQAEKTLLVFFWWEGSDYGKRARQHLQSDEAASRLDSFVCFNADFQKPGMEPLFKKFNVQIAPSVLYVGSDGKGVDFVGGYLEKQEFMKDLDRVLARGEGTIPFLQSQLTSVKKGSDEDIELRLKLAGKMQDVADHHGHDAMYMTLASADPNGRTLEGCRAHMMVFNRELGLNDSDSDGDSEHSSSPEDMDLASCYDFAKRAEHEDGRFEVWSALVRMELLKGDSGKALKALKKADQMVSEERASGWRGQMSRTLCSYSDRLETKGKKMALKLAQLSLDSFDKNQLKDGDGGGDSGADSDGGPDRALSYRWDTLAWALTVNGKTKAALDAARKSVELSPSDENQARLVALQKDAN